MSLQLKYVAQQAMDNYYQQFKSAQDFFDLRDFIDRCGNILSGIYLKLWDIKRAEIRADKQDELPVFDTEMLAEFELKVTRKDGVLFSDITALQVMSFPFDTYNIGFQDILLFCDGKPVPFDRTSLTAAYQLHYAPQTNRIFWYIAGKKIIYWTNGQISLEGKSPVLYYVPAVHDEMEVPDTLVDQIVLITVTEMKQMKDGVVVKKALDDNPNAILQSEMNKLELK